MPPSKTSSAASVNIFSPTVIIGLTGNLPKDARTKQPRGQLVPSKALASRHGNSWSYRRCRRQLEQMAEWKSKQTRLSPFMVFRASGAAPLRSPEVIFSSESSPPRVQRMQQAFRGTTTFRSRLDQIITQGKATHVSVLRLLDR